jgi:hypothetical protein
MAYFLYPMRVLVGKLETTPGTMETLTSADFDVRVRNPEITPTVEIDDEASKWARGDHGEDDVITGSQSAQITFAVRLTKGTTVTTAPNWFKFASGCGMLPVLYAGKGYGLQPRKQYDEKTMTIWVYDIKRGATPTAVCYKFAGCMGNMVVAAGGVGKPWMVNFTFTGKLDSVDMAVANGDILQMIIGQATCAEKFISAGANIGSHAEKVSQFSLDVGNEISPVIDQSDKTGYSHYGITARKPRLTMNPLMDSTHDVYADLANGVTGCAASYPIMIGDTGVNGRVSLHVPRGQIIGAGLANREGLVGWDMNIKCEANGYTGSVACGDLEPEVTWEALFGSRS